MFLRRLRGVGAGGAPLTYEDTTVIVQDTTNGSTASPSNNVSWDTGDTLVVLVVGRVANSTGWRPSSMTLSHSTEGSFTREASEIKISGNAGFEPWAAAFVKTATTTNAGAGTWTVADNFSGTWANVALICVRFSGGVDTVDGVSNQLDSSVTPSNITSDSFVIAAASDKDSASLAYTGATSVSGPTNFENAFYQVWVHSPTETAPLTVNGNDGSYVAICLDPV